jgi:hypothetical protein
MTAGYILSLPFDVLSFYFAGLFRRFGSPARRDKQAPLDNAKRSEVSAQSV